MTHFCCALWDTPYFTVTGLAWYLFICNVFTAKKGPEMHPGALAARRVIVLSVNKMIGSDEENRLFLSVNWRLDTK